MADIARMSKRSLEGLSELARTVAESLGTEISAYGEFARATVEAGGRLLFCGNGGSAADAQHLAAEYVVRLERKRGPLAALALTTDTSVLTASANDLGYEQVFARQVEALGRPGDLLVLHSTSGESENLIRAAGTATRAGLFTVALLARGGGRLRSMVDVAIVVPTDRPSRAQGNPPRDRPYCVRVRRRIDPGEFRVTSLKLDLAGKRALVTGGSRGVGAATVHLLARAGADVGISYRTRAAEARGVVEEARALGVRSWAEAGDLSDRTAAGRLFRRVDGEFGGLDIFVGNAGIWPVADVPVSEMDDDRWHRTIAVNLDSIFFTTREAIRRMDDDGRIVLVSSTAGQRGEAYHSDYAREQGRDPLAGEGAVRGGGGVGNHRQRRGPGLDRHRDVRGRAAGRRPGRDRGGDPDREGGHSRRRGRTDRDALLAVGPAYHG